MRVTNGRRERVAVWIDGGQRTELPGTWSASVEWLVARLAPRFTELAFAEVRYRVRSWRRLDLCVEDAREAVRAAGGSRTLLVGFSMGGAVAIRAADEPSVERVLGLAPWIPDRLDLSPLAGRRLDVLHGALDTGFAGLPGVSPRQSRRGFDRAAGLGVAGTYTLVPGGLHGVALRGRRGRPVPLPRAARWADLVARELERFAACPGGALPEA